MPPTTKSPFSDEWGGSGHWPVAQQRKFKISRFLFCYRSHNCGGTLIDGTSHPFWHMQTKPFRFLWKLPYSMNTFFRVRQLVNCRRSRVACMDEMITHLVFCFYGVGEWVCIFQFRKKMSSPPRHDIICDTFITTIEGRHSNFHFVSAWAYDSPLSCRPHQCDLCFAHHEKWMRNWRALLTMNSSSA